VTKVGEEVGGRGGEWERAGVGGGRRGEGGMGGGGNTAFDGEEGPNVERGSRRVKFAFKPKSYVKEVRTKESDKQGT